LKLTISLFYYTQFSASIRQTLSLYFIFNPIELEGEKHLLEK